MNFISRNNNLCDNYTYFREYSKVRIYSILTRMPITRTSKRNFYSLSHHTSRSTDLVTSSSRKKRRNAVTISAFNYEIRRSRENSIKSTHDKFEKGCDIFARIESPRFFSPRNLSAGRRLGARLGGGGGRDKFSFDFIGASPRSNSTPSKVALKGNIQLGD